LANVSVTGPPADVQRHVPFRSKSEYAIPRHLQWDSQLILPKLPFPNKSAAFTVRIIKMWCFATSVASELVNETAETKLSVTLWIWNNSST